MVSKGYYILSGKEGDFIIRLIELCLDYPEESKPSLIAIKEVIMNGFKEHPRTGRHITQEHIQKLIQGRRKMLNQTRQKHKTDGILSQAKVLDIARHDDKTSEETEEKQEMMK